MSDRFTDCVELLLTGTVICQQSDDGLFRYLSDSSHFDDVTQYLNRISRTVLVTQDKAGFYCGYLEPNDAKLKIRRQFEQATERLEGLVGWLRLARMAINADRPLVTGEVVREGDMLNAMEASPILQAQLSDVAHKLKAGRKDSEPGRKLRAVLAYLEEAGYLVAQSGTGSVYIATAKWSLLYEQLAFIVQFDELIDEVEESAPVQGEMF